MNINIILKFMLYSGKFLRALKIAFILTKLQVDNA